MYNKIKTKYYLASVESKLQMSDKELHYLKNNPTTIRLMSAYGYDAQKIAAFNAVNEEARAANHLKHNGFVDKVVANSEFKKQFAGIKKQIAYLIRIARVVFEQEAEILNLLQLNGRQKRSVLEQLDFMDHFYQHLLTQPALAERLAVFGYPPATLLVYQEEYRAARTAFNNLSRDSVDAKEATRVRNQKMAELDKWMREYYTFAKIAYELNPDWLDIQQAEEEAGRKK